MLSVEQQVECVRFLEHAYRIAARFRWWRRDVEEFQGIAHLAVVEAVLGFDPAGPRDLETHVRYAVYDALRAAFDPRLPRNRTKNLGEAGEPLAPPERPPAWVTAEWVDRVLGQLGDTADEALAHRVFVVGERVSRIAAEVDTSKAYASQLYRKVVALRNRLAGIIARELPDRPAWRSA
jgi:hypothetical protein